MLQCEPRKFFPLTWNVPDPDDNTTYYVRAYIYVFGSAGERSELETVDLTDNADQTFIYRYQMPADPSGQGRPVIVHYRVFTDSGYTTEQTLYGQPAEEKYLVKSFPIGGGGFFGGVGKAISYLRIGRIIRKELKKLPKPEKQKEVDLEPVLEAIVNNKINIKPILEAIKNSQMDLGPVLNELRNTQKQIKEKETDLKPILKAIDKAKLNEAQGRIEKVFEKIRQFFTTDTKQFQKSVDELQNEFKKRVFMAVPVGEETVSEKPPIEKSKKGKEPNKNILRGFSQ